MGQSGKIFADLVGSILARFYQQNGQPAPSTPELEALAARLWALVGELGLPPPLARSEQGTPRDWPAEEVAPLVGRVLGPQAPRDGLLATAARQLVKACFQPEFKTCRDSYREAEPDGTCRRQDLCRVRGGRISGAHCVDCPHWTALSPEQHGKFLRRGWRPAGVAEFDEHRGVFLPEDFRTLRRFLREQARLKS